QGLVAIVQRRADEVDCVDGSCVEILLFRRGAGGLAGKLLPQREKQTRCLGIKRLRRGGRRTIQRQQLVEVDNVRRERLDGVCRAGKRNGRGLRLMFLSLTLFGVSAKRDGEREDHQKHQGELFHKGAENSVSRYKRKADGATLTSTSGAPTAETGSNPSESI